MSDTPTWTLREIDVKADSTVTLSEHVSYDHAMDALCDMLEGAGSDHMVISASPYGRPWPLSCARPEMWLYCTGFKPGRRVKPTSEDWMSCERTNPDYMTVLGIFAPPGNAA